MIIDLLREEAYVNFQVEFNPKWHGDDYYHLHCSHAFANSLKQEFTTIAQKSGFLVERTEDEPVTKFTRYQIPNIGLLNVIEDMEQGYRLEKIGNLKQS